jgi:hypothetical protein
MKNLILPVLITFTILSCMFLPTSGIFCYSCSGTDSNCTDTLDTCLTTVLECSETTECSVCFLKIS